MSAGPSGADTEAKAPVSVVIPCYQARGSLARALRSVAAQTLQPLEVIVVDDASTDGTWEEIGSLQTEFAPGWMRPVKLDKNAGVSAARNAGWDMARGEVVAFLDADDAWHPRKLEVQWRTMRESPGLSLTGHKFMLDGCSAPQIDPVPEVRDVSAWALLWKNRFVTPSVMLRRELPLRFASGQRYMEDHRLWMEVALTGYRIGLIDAPLAILFKPAYVHSGLSANLRAMEAAELSNYRAIRQAGRIGVLLCFALQIWSLLKYSRRIVLRSLYRRRMRRVQV